MASVLEVCSLPSHHKPQLRVPAQPVIDAAGGRALAPSEGFGERHPARARSQASNEQRNEHSKAGRGGQTDAERDAEQQIEGVIHRREYPSRTAPTKATRAYRGSLAESHYSKVSFDTNVRSQLSRRVRSVVRHEQEDRQCTQHPTLSRDIALS